MTALLGTLGSYDLMCMIGVVRDILSFSCNVPTAMINGSVQRRCAVVVVVISVWLTVFRVDVRCMCCLCVGALVRGRVLTNKWIGCLCCPALSFAACSH
jgi:hypothetical protein